MLLPNQDLKFYCYFNNLNHTFSSFGDEYACTCCVQPYVKSLYDLHAIFMHSCSCRVVLVPQNHCSSVPPLQSAYPSFIQLFGMHASPSQPISPLYSAAPSYAHPCVQWNSFSRHSAKWNNIACYVRLSLLALALPQCFAFPTSNNQKPSLPSNALAISSWMTDSPPPLPNVGRGLF